MMTTRSEVVSWSYTTFSFNTGRPQALDPGRSQNISLKWTFQMKVEVVIQGQSGRLSRSEIAFADQFQHEQA